MGIILNPGKGPAIRPFEADRGIPADGLSDSDFQRMCRLIYETIGINIVAGKRALLEGRISRRISHLGLKGYREYCNFLFSAAGRSRELTSMVDAVTTNKTDFFREPFHFEFLKDRALPYLNKLYGAGTRRSFNVWSAACSSGEEPYTAAMVLADAARCKGGVRYDILGTDISTKVLDLAGKGIYDEEHAEPIPIIMRKKYLLRSRDRRKKLVRIAPEIRANVRFSRLNLMDEDYGITHPIDIIFCRNVIIYFDRPTQERVIRRLCRHLVPGGYLFMGHSENLTNMNVDVRYAAPSTYQKCPEGSHDPEDKSSYRG